MGVFVFFFFKQKTAYEMRISDWSSDVCSSDLRTQLRERLQALIPEEEKGGLIVRTQAEGATDEALSADLEYLRKLWSRVPAAARRQPDPALLPPNLTLAPRVLRAMVGLHPGVTKGDSRTTTPARTALANP